MHGRRVGKWVGVWAGMASCIALVGCTVMVEDEAEAAPLGAGLRFAEAITMERWRGVQGMSVEDIPLDRPPDEVRQLRAFEAPTDVGNAYGVRIRGYLVPPRTGAYTFWIAGDDNAELWLSRNGQADHAEPIAWHEDWTRPRQWDKHATQRSRSIELVAGRRYYVHALMKEHYGGDNLAVAWSKPGERRNWPSEIVPGSALAPYVPDGDEDDRTGDDGSGDDGSGDDGSGDGAGGGGDGTDEPCVRARRLWHEDFETGNYDRWSSNSYVSGLNPGGCYESGFSTARSVDGSHSHRTSVGCAASSNHRIYSGVQFSGDTPLARYTNSGVGIDAPQGIVITYWSWLDAPGFGNGRWFSSFTANNHCNWQDHVVTLGLEDPSHRQMPAHIWTTGGHLELDDDAPSFPFRRWVRTTIYLNYHDGELHVWQDGRSVVHGYFSRNTREICQFHWGLYASGNNSDITLFEDAMSLWKLEEPWSDFRREPWLGQSQATCR